MLLSAIFGDDRTTIQDMDAMIKGIPLDAREIGKVINEIINIDCEDGISYSLKKSSEIRLNDKYGGIRVSLLGYKEHLQVPLSIDIKGNEMTCESYQATSQFYNQLLNSNVEKAKTEDINQLVLSRVK